MRTVSSALIIVLITFLLAEVTLRVYHHFNPVFIFPTDSYNRFRGKPFDTNYDFPLNSRGFNDVEFQEEKDPGVYRIIGIGDSMVFSVVPYRYNFLTLLEDGLNNHDHRRYEVVNMGIPGANLQDYQSILVTEGLELEPDMLLLCVFIGNDLSGSPERQRPLSYVASFLAFLFHMPQQIETSQAISGTYQDDRPSFSNEEYLTIEMQHSILFRLGYSGPDTWIPNAMAYIQGIQAICERRGIRLLLVILPDELQVNRTLQQTVMQRMQPADQRMDFDLPNRLLTAALQGAGIAYLDLLQPFRAAATRIPLYKPQDTHWNIAGNQLAATLIADHLLRQAIIPAPLQAHLEDQTGIRTVAAGNGKAR